MTQTANAHAGKTANKEWDSFKPIDSRLPTGFWPLEWEQSIFKWAQILGPKQPFAASIATVRYGPQAVNL